jgi:hypothetical protein
MLASIFFQFVSDRAGSVMLWFNFQLCWVDWIQPNLDESLWHSIGCPPTREPSCPTAMFGCSNLWNVTRVIWNLVNWWYNLWYLSPLSGWYKCCLNFACHCILLETFHSLPNLQRAVVSNGCGEIQQTMECLKVPWIFKLFYGSYSQVITKLFGNTVAYNTLIGTSQFSWWSSILVHCRNSDDQFC